jgi:hypothetical protein
MPIAEPLDVGHAALLSIKSVFAWNPGGQLLPLITCAKPACAKQRLTIDDGTREPPASWQELQLDLKGHDMH